MVAVWRKREEEFRRLKQDEYKPSEDDDRRCLCGVLLAGEIERLANERNLIKPFEKVHLKPAAYQLTVGNEYFVGGEYFTLDGDDKTIVIRPFEVVVVKIYETICMPRYLIARWNIKVTLAYKGLLWVGGPQVDPGYVGHLFCPIYNLSNRDVTIRFRDEIAVIDFTKTTSFEKDKVGQSEYERYPWPPKRVIIEDYGIDDFKSALYHYVKERVDKMEASVGSVENRLAWFTTLVLTIFAIIIGSISFLYGKGIPDAISLWGLFVIAFSAVAFFLALFWYVSNRFQGFLHRRLVEVAGRGGHIVSRFLNRNWTIGLGASLLLAFVFAALVTFWLDPFNKRLLLRKDDLNTAVEELRRQTSGAMTETETRLYDQVKRLIDMERAERLRSEQQLRDALPNARP